MDRRWIQGSFESAATPAEPLPPPPPPPEPAWKARARAAAEPVAASGTPGAAASTPVALDDGGGGGGDGKTASGSKVGADAGCDGTPNVVDARTLVEGAVRKKLEAFVLDLLEAGRVTREEVGVALSQS